MDESQWLLDYFRRYERHLADAEVCTHLVELAQLLREMSRHKGKAIMAGNGGSAAMASHVATDLTKNAKIRAVCFNEPSLITCLANDYGYERWLAKAVELYADPQDVVVLISTSGCSPNIVAAAHAAQQSDLRLVTLSGSDPDNPLRAMGGINLWVESKAYNIVETVHQMWLLAVVDLLIGRAEYPPC